VPRAINADWNLAQALYVQGVPYKTIAERVGVTEMSLRQRAHRHGWHALKTEALATASQAVTQHSGKTLVQRSAEVRSALADEVGESITALRQTPTKPELEHLNQRAEVAGKLTSSASKVFGWNGEGEAPIVIVGTMRRALDLQAEVTVEPVQVEAPQLA
jgi:stress-induced morphogen